MPIANTDIIYRRAALASDETPAQNGGRMLATAIASAVKNNLFPDTRTAERTNGSDVWRKLFVHVSTTGNEQFLDASACLQAPTSGDDYTLLYAGSAIDTQDQVSGRPYGIGTTAAAADASDTELVLAIEGSEAAVALEPIRAGDTLRITPEGSPVDVVVDSVLASGGTLTATLTAPLAAAVASGVHVAAVLPLGTIAAGVNTPTITSAAGTLSAISPRNRGGVQQVWTLSFTSATAYRLDGDTLGANVANGTTTADFAPANSGLSAPYFAIPASAWGGTWAMGDTVVFTTTPAAAGLWLRRVTPAGAAPAANNGASVLVMGESE
jgi:hypothetical protein